MTQIEQPRESDGRFGGYPYERADPNLVFPMTGPIAFEFSDDPDSMSDEDYNAGGTYDYPPAPRSARQVRAFWSTVQVPDVALTHYEKVYRQDVEQYVSQKVASWDKTHPKPNPGSDIGPENRAWKAERAEATAEFRAERPEQVPRHLLRLAVRSVGMLRDSRSLPDAEGAALMASPAQIPGQGATTVQGVVNTYGTWFLSKQELALAPTSDLQSRRLEDIAADLRSANADLATRIGTTYEAVDRLHRSQSAVWLEEDYRAGRKKRPRG